MVQTIQKIAPNLWSLLGILDAKVLKLVKKLSYSVTQKVSGTATDVSTIFAFGVSVFLYSLHSSFLV
jgi:hypothetical protein